MSDSSDHETRWLRGGAILTGVTAVVLFVLASLGISLPLFLPLLLLAAASGLMLASRTDSR